MPSFGGLRFQIGDDWLGVGYGGWLYWSGMADEETRFDVRLHVVEHEGGRYAIDQIAVAATGSAPEISSTDLKSLRLGQLSAVINAEPWRSQIERALKADSGQSFSPCDGPRMSGETWNRIVEVRRGEAREPSLRLSIPATRRYPDEFYAQVAEIFNYQSTRSSHPALDISRANDVAVTVVHRWVKEAKRRGHSLASASSSASVPTRGSPQTG